MKNYDYEIDIFFKDLLESYLKQRKLEIHKLKLALTENDYSYLESKGHDLAGTGGSYGLSELTDIGDRLETAAAGKENENCNRILELYEEFLNQVRIKYK